MSKLLKTWLYSMLTLFLATSVFAHVPAQIFQSDLDSQPQYSRPENNDVPIKNRVGKISDSSAYFTTKLTLQPVELHREISAHTTIFASGRLNLVYFDPFGLCAQGSGGSGWGNAWDGAVYGDYAGDSGWAGVGAQVAVGFVPVAGQIADARDTVANVQNVWNNPSSGSAWAGLGGTALAWLPGVGDALKGVFKGGRKAATEISQAALRNTDELTTTLYHGGKLRGTGKVEYSYKGFSTTPSMAHAQSYADEFGGQVHSFDVPSKWFNDMKSSGQTMPFSDTLKSTGSMGEEWRFYGDAAVDLNKYLNP